MTEQVRWLVRLMVTQDDEVDASPKDWDWSGCDADAVVLSAEPVGFVAPDEVESGVEK